MTLALILFVGGLLQTTYAVWAIRTDDAKKNINLIEAAVHKVAGSEPLPKSRLGLAFDRSMEWAVLLLGLVFLAFGSLLLWAEIF
ncbi:hypothetical protein [Sphingomonas sp.]|uniref:hypothetical protein n=1 Tax=Sphingomonas sp. TaxID=28214 RepID=UPI0018486E51|nr:hypothetical protein [Sphingomonas sp.]MBA3512710.1 hypothetical protein [Sphingomonas sp.]